MPPPQSAYTLSLLPSRLQAAREAKKLLEEGELHMKEKMAIQLGLQKHREVAELAEVATHERIRQLQMRRIREDVSASVSLVSVPANARGYSCPLLFAVGEERVGDHEGP
jgi:hypothetical protein